jgi:transposase InsO family protein
MKLKKPAIFICLLCAAFAFTACGGDWPSDVEYIFTNDSGSYISVYFDQPFGYERYEEGGKSRTELGLYTDSSTTIYFSISNSNPIVDFRWEPSPLSAYNSIDCIIDGTKATFRKR